MRFRNVIDANRNRSDDIYITKDIFFLRVRSDHNGKYYWFVTGLVDKIFTGMEGIRVFHLANWGFLGTFQAEGIYPYRDEFEEIIAIMRNVDQENNLRYIPYYVVLTID